GDRRRCVTGTGGRCVMWVLWIGAGVQRLFDGYSQVACADRQAQAATRVGRSGVVDTLSECASTRSSTGLPLECFALASGSGVALRLARCLVLAAASPGPRGLATHAA